MPPLDYLDPFASVTPQMYAPQTPVYRGPLNFPTNNPMVAMMQQVMGGPISNFMANQGMVPSQFFPMQSLFDQARTKQYYEGRQEALKFAARTDAGTYESTILGGFRAMGWGETAQSRQFARTLATDISAIAPTLAQVAPVMFDRLHGRRGSATMLADSVYRAGQMGIDPSLGRYGMSGMSAGIVSQEVFGQLYGPNANVRAMKGFGAGEMGMLYEDLMARGSLGSTVGGMRPMDQVRALAGAQFDTETMQRMASRTGLSMETLQKSQARLKGMASSGNVDLKELDELPGLQDMLASFDATRTGGRLKEMSGVVAAMREIFGDAGHPNAPMRQLMDGLEKLTQGGMSQMSPQALERRVRETHALARQSGVDMRTVFGLAAGGAELADQLRLSRQFVLGATTGSIAFGAAAGNQGNMDIPAWGAMSKEQLTLYDQRLRLNAAASPMANRMNMVMRLRDQGIIQEGTAGAAMASAIAAGDTSFSFDGKTYSTSMGEQQLKALLTGGKNGITDTQYGSAIYARHANQEYGVKYDTATAVRAAQAATDTRQVWESAFGGQTRAALVEAGVAKDQDAINIANSVGAAMTATLQNMDSKDYRDTGRRNAALQASAKQAITAALKKQGKSDAQITAALTKMGAEGLLGIAVGGWGAADEILSGDYWGRTGAMGRMQLDDKNTEFQARSRRAAAVSEAQIQTEQAGLGMDNPLRRLTDAIIDSKPGEDTSALAAKLLGGLDPKDVQASDPIVQGYLAQFEAFRDAEMKDGQLTAAGVKQRSTAVARMEAIRSGSGGSAKVALASMAKEFGVSDPTMLRNAITDKYRKDPTKMQQMLNTLTALEAASKGADLNEYMKGKDVILGQQVKRQAIQDSVDAHEKAVELQDGLLGKLAGGRFTDEVRGSKEYREAHAATLEAINGNAGLADIMGDEKAMEQLGAGGYDLVQGAMDADRQLRVLAKESGYTVSQLLMGDVKAGDEHYAHEAGALQEKMANSWKDINSRQTGKKPAAPMTQAERDLAAQRRASGQAYATETAATEGTLERMLDMLSPSSRAGINDKDRAALKGEMLEGHRGEVLQQAVEADKALGQMAKRAGLLGDKYTAAEEQDAIKKLLAGEGNLSADDQAGLKILEEQRKLISGIGDGQGDDAAELKSLIDSIKKSESREEARKRDTEKKEPTKITGTLRLLDPENVLLAGTAEFDLGQTPVSGSA